MKYVLALLRLLKGLTGIPRKAIGLLADFFDEHPAYVIGAAAIAATWLVRVLDLPAGWTGTIQTAVAAAAIYAIHELVIPVNGTLWQFVDSVLKNITTPAPSVAPAPPAPPPPPVDGPTTSGVGN